MSTVTAGPFAAVAALLAVAGVAKLLRPATTVAALEAAGLRLRPGRGRLLGRTLGAAEVVVAVAAIAVGGRGLALVVASTYLGFAAFTMRVITRSAGAAGCGCFGAEDAPATNLHVALNLGAASIAGVAAAAPPGPLLDVIGAQPLAGVPFVALVALCTWLGYVAYTLLPALDLDQVES